MDSVAEALTYTSFSFQQDADREATNVTYRTCKSENFCVVKILSFKFLCVLFSQSNIVAKIFYFVQLELRAHTREVSRQVQC